MKYPTISILDGKRHLEALRQRDPRPASVRWIGEGSGECFDADRVDDMVRALQALRRGMGEPGEGDRRYFARFEGRAAAVVHEMLELPAFVAADHEFWIWLTIGSGFDYPATLVTWRHGRDESPFDARDDNYGLTTNLEGGFFSRAWLRANAVYDPARDDPFELAQRGDQDLWRSHILRTEYGQVPSLAKALLLFQYPDAHPENAKVTTAVIREIAKELRRRQATTAFELLSFEEARELVEDVHSTVSGSRKGA